MSSFGMPVTGAKRPRPSSRPRHSTKARHAPLNPLEALAALKRGDAGADTAVEMEERPAVQDGVAAKRPRVPKAKMVTPLGALLLQQLDRLGQSSDETAPSSKDTTDKKQKKKSRAASVSSGSDSGSESDSDSDAGDAPSASVSAAKQQENGLQQHSDDMGMASTIRVSSVPAEEGSILSQAAAWGMCAPLVHALGGLGLSKFFPIQSSLLPPLLSSDSGGDLSSPDIAVTAPTGSGKTLMYTLPMLNALLTRNPHIHMLRALVIVPTRDLARQVAGVINRLIELLPAGTPKLNVYAATGQAPFATEQRVLALAGGLDAVPGDVVMGCGEDPWIPDILVATPGRLVEHLSLTTGFTLQHLLYLVCDEADRLLSERYSDWPRKVREAIFPCGLEPERSYIFPSGYPAPSDSGTAENSAPPTQGKINLATRRQLRPEGARVGYLTSSDPFEVLRFANASYKSPLECTDEPAWLRQSWEFANRQFMGSTPILPTVTKAPFRRIVCSATLTSNPRKLASLHLQTPMHFVANVDVSASKTAIHDGVAKKQYTTPLTLCQAYTVCGAAEKPVVLIHLLRLLQGQAATELKSGLRALVFTGSVETTHRLTRLLELYGGLHGKVAEFSAALTQTQRNELLASAEAGEISVIIASDVAARGIDLPSLPAVIHYDAPPRMKTYIHRVGRSARAGKVGLSYTILKPEQMRHFKMNILDRLSPSVAIQKETVLASAINPYLPRMESVLSALGGVLERERMGSLTTLEHVRPVGDLDGRGDSISVPELSLDAPAVEKDNGVDSSSSSESEDSDSSSDSSSSSSSSSSDSDSD